MPDIGTALAELSPVWIYAVAALAAGLASVALPGWFVPGQTAAVAAGALAGAGQANFGWLVCWVAAGATSGCQVGYWIGSVIRRRRPNWRPHGRLAPWWDYATDRLRRRPVGAVMVGRWNAALRACLPNAAGVAGTGAARFFGWNSLACVIWAGVVTGAGLAIHHAVRFAQLGLSAASALALLIVIWVLWFGYRRWRQTLPPDNPNPFQPAAR
ncbi:MAG: VTT domain-containing protein [Bifidobacteriaceae bacterium]|jgi:membrane protein DedA with SNARE-associated domain|nr:VTT domain-containing protein [Bifidobacteriaceae bacterium]